MSSLYSIGAMNQLGDSLEAAGFTADHVTKLKQYKELEKIKLLLDGCAEIVQIKHMINCNADPFLPDGWKVEIHCHGGQFEWDASKVSLYFSEQQKNDKVIVGNELRKELESMETLNANVLDYLLKNQHLIPEDWKGKGVFFGERFIATRMATCTSVTSAGMASGGVGTATGLTVASILTLLLSCAS